MALEEEWCKGSPAAVELAVRRRRRLGVADQAEIRKEAQKRSKERRPERPLVFLDIEVPKGETTQLHNRSRGYRLTQTFLKWRVGSPYNPVYVQQRETVKSLDFWVGVGERRKVEKWVAPETLNQRYACTISNWKRSVGFQWNGYCSPPWHDPRKALWNLYFWRGR